MIRFRSGTAARFGYRLLALLAVVQAGADSEAPTPPLAPIGKSILFRHRSPDNLRGSVVREFQVQFGRSTLLRGQSQQWVSLDLTKADGSHVRSWWLLDRWPVLTQPSGAVGRYLLQEPAGPVVEFTDPTSGHAVLPSLIPWARLLPQARDTDSPLTGSQPPPSEVSFLGHSYQLAPEQTPSHPGPVPTPDRIIRLQPNLLVGLPSNRKQKDETRRYDNSDYEYVRLTAEDYRRMVEAGFTCLRVDLDQLDAVAALDAFHWGPAPSDLPFPESLYRSTYLGPALFLDEPAVTTRDALLRPRLAKEPSFRQSITPQAALLALGQHFEHLLREGTPVSWRKSLSTRADLDPGTIDWPQSNLYTWETMVASGGYQLSRDPLVPAAIVFEPPGRIGSRRTLPEWNMAYGCQLRVDVPAHFTEVIFGLLRGAARATQKNWGTSIYGALDRADGPWFFTHAYDLGATHFFFWDNYHLACVPFGESLSLARHLRDHAAQHPDRDLDRLRRAAEIALVFPPGYNLGHVHMGRGNLWGIPELNLERTNHLGVPYRTLMGNLFLEIERCLRLGTAFDLLWDLPEIQPTGYREVVRIRPDGRVEVHSDQTHRTFATARMPDRPAGHPPQLDLTPTDSTGNPPFHLTAVAVLTETSSPVFYTTGADPNGVYHNARVGWELFGPGDADYHALIPTDHRPEIHHEGGRTRVTTRTTLDRPGTYRLRAATSDLAGRTAVRWATFTVTSAAQ